ncbi:MAG: hypothetical protein AB7K24_29280 [Gemmataceae bacterium]
MSNRLGPIEIDCDAPPYAIVRACQMVGIQAPEDVRWCRMTNFANQQITWRDILRHPWRLFVRRARIGNGMCACGQKLPGLEKCTFTRVSGRKSIYHIGQCAQCKTIYWEEG